MRKVIAVHVPQNVYTLAEWRKAVFDGARPPIIAYQSGTSGTVTILLWDFAPDGVYDRTKKFDEMWFYFSDLSGIKHSATKGLDKFIERITREGTASHLFAFDNAAELMKWIADNKYTVSV